MKRTRRPRQAFERLYPLRPTSKQRIHMLLRQNPSLNIQQLAKLVGCTRAYARTWRHNFFAPGYEPTDPSVYDQEAGAI